MNTSIFISEESARCMLCQNAPCTKAVHQGSLTASSVLCDLITYLSP